MSKCLVFKSQKLLFWMLKNFSTFNLPKNIQNGKMWDSKNKRQSMRGAKYSGQDSNFNWFCFNCFGCRRLSARDEIE